MENSKKIHNKFIIFIFTFVLLCNIQALSNSNNFPEDIIIPNEVLNYANRHNLKLEVDKYEIEKSDVENGNKYKYIYPCSTKDGQIYAILYRNKFFIKTATPRALNIIYIGTR